MNLILDAMYHQHVCSSHDKQFRLQEIIGTEGWRFETGAGTLSFGDRLSVKAQVLGNESVYNNSWIWAWANRQAGYPARLIEAACALRDYGLKKGVPELTTPEFMLGDIDGHFLSVIASGAVKAGGYYCGKCEGGSIFLLIMDPEYKIEVADPLARIRQVYSHVMANNEVNHERAFVGYVRYYGLESEKHEDTIRVADAAGRCLTARFDEQGRLLHLFAIASHAGRSTGSGVRRSKRYRPRR